MSIDSDSNRSTQYEGYSDYSAVSRNVSTAVDEAVEAYALIQSHHTEGARVSPETGAEAAAHILGAALKLQPELENDRDQNDTYDNMLDSWQGDDGYIERLKTTPLSSNCPDWIGEFVVDIREAGFELGYLKAGRETDRGPDDVVERDAEQMFDR